MRLDKGIDGYRGRFLGSPDERNMTANLITRYIDCYDKLTPSFDRMLKNWSNFLGNTAIKDPRDKDKEKWRSFVNVPKAWSNTTAVGGIVTDIITSVQPIIQVTRAKDLKLDTAQYGEALCDYTLIGNHFRTRVLPPLVRATEIQGTQFIKMSWVDRSRQVTVAPGMIEYEDFGTLFSLR